VSVKKQILPLFISFCILLQSLIPTGFMPSFSSGAYTIEICSGLQTNIIQIDDEDHQDEHTGTHELCPYFIGYAFTSTDVAQLVTVDARTINLHYRIEDQKFSKAALFSNKNRGPPKLSLT
jgi:hypothetical protein